MAKIHKIKGRIKSVKKVGQITKAMERVAASKMRRANEAALRSRAYSASAREVLAHLFILTSAGEHVLFARRPVKRQLIILFSSDRGLAGAYNSNLFKLFLNTLTVPTDVIAIGQKGANFVTSLRRIHIHGVYTNWPSRPAIEDISPIVQTALRAFEEKTVDAVKLLFTDFVSLAKQEAVIRDVLPIDPQALLGKQGRIGRDILEAEFEPSPREVLEYMVPRLLEVQIYQAALEAIASEHSMRMMAMKNASDNATELSDDLTLSFNRARQAGITQELAEITAGAGATQ